MSTPVTSSSQIPAGTAADQRRDAARQYLQDVRVFHTHAGVAAASMVLIIAVNVFSNVAAGTTGYLWAWWSVWALLGWGLGLTIHGLVVRGTRPQSLVSAREEEQINEILSSESTQPRR